MSEFCTKCGQVHDGACGGTDELAELQKLKEKEVRAIQQLVATQKKATEFISFPKVGFDLLTRLAAAPHNHNLTPVQLATLTCDIIDAYAAEIVKRWGVAEPVHE